MGFGRASFLKFMGAFSVLKAVSVLQSECTQYVSGSLVLQNRIPVTARFAAHKRMEDKRGERRACGQGNTSS